MDFFTKNDPKNGFDGPNSRFWRKWGSEMQRMGMRYPNLRANRAVTADNTPGEWVISGGPPEAIHTYRKLVAEAARKLGYHGGELGAVQFWLDHQAGDHIIRRQPKERKDDDRESQVTYRDGTIHRFRGRQQIG